jgi:hypothetical protein
MPAATAAPLRGAPMLHGNRAQIKPSPTALTRIASMDQQSRAAAVVRGRPRPRRSSLMLLHVQPNAPTSERRRAPMLARSSPRESVGAWNHEPPNATFESGGAAATVPRADVIGDIGRIEEGVGIGQKSTTETRVFSPCRRT